VARCEAFRLSGFLVSLSLVALRELTIRLVSFKVQTPGYRTKTITLATTLLDVKAYPDSALAELYRLRWQVEGCFRDLKVTLGLDILRT
jgi:IS4 transposase